MRKLKPHRLKHVVNICYIVQFRFLCLNWGFGQNYLCGPIFNLHTNLRIASNLPSVDIDTRAVKIRLLTVKELNKLL